MNAIAPAASRASVRLAAYGDWLRDHAGVVRAVQWIVVAAYLILLAVPAWLPLPGQDAHALDNFTVFAQWAFWGLWWPFVLLSMLVAGRTWCGVFCPEGTLTEAASRVGLQRAVPRWMRWGGWPFVAFATTTVFGQLVSVYQYAPAALVVLGGSTVAAIVVGLVYGREKRVWCRHLCPVNGVFSVLARVAPVHFRVDRAAWARNAGRIAVHPVNCAPLVRIKRMEGPSECQMCGRCSGHLGAIALSFRPPNREVATLADERASGWDATLIVVGLIGFAIGAFHWSASPWFVQAKLAAAAFVIDHGPAWLLSDGAPWWLLTHYPEANDVFTWLDGALIVGYIAATAAALSSLVWACLLVAAGTWRTPRAARAVRLAYALVPLAGLGVFLGLSSLTVTLAKAEGLPLGAVPALRVLVLAAGAAWSLRLAWLQLADAPDRGARVRALLAFACAVAVVVAAWALLFFGWG
ncbi:MAG TPA: 4Fe-4S binding protein [Casimicrobiaceae bacterium]|nr:4Fe-4S binding protein [Casimicrobiaceae bacterium]